MTWLVDVLEFLSWPIVGLFIWGAADASWIFFLAELFCRWWDYRLED
jgi:hypothetical protein